MANTIVPHDWERWASFVIVFAMSFYGMGWMHKWLDIAPFGGTMVTVIRVLAGFGFYLSYRIWRRQIQGI